MLKSQTTRPVYIAIDLKSYYASVECVERGLNPLTTNLLVADETRSDKTICLAVSPSLKAMGVPSRPRLFEAKQAIKLYEAQHHTKVEYIIAKPQMALYEKVSAKIYSIYLQYISTCDIHVYSIDEVFIEATHYMTMYAAASEAAGMETPHYLAMTMIWSPGKQGRRSSRFGYRLTPSRLRNFQATTARCLWITMAGFIHVMWSEACS